MLSLPERLRRRGVFTAALGLFGAMLHWPLARFAAGGPDSLHPALTGLSVLLIVALVWWLWPHGRRGGARMVVRGLAFTYLASALALCAGVLPYAVADMQAGEWANGLIRLLGVTFLYPLLAGLMMLGLPYALGAFIAWLFREPSPPSR